MNETGWQAHAVRGFMSVTPKKAGLVAMGTGANRIRRAVRGEAVIMRLHFHANLHCPSTCGSTRNRATIDWNTARLCREESMRRGSVSPAGLAHDYLVSVAKPSIMNQSW
jgi:hypothetical protein